MQDESFLEAGEAAIDGFLRVPWFGLVFVTFIMVGVQMKYGFTRADLVKKSSPLITGNWLLCAVAIAAVYYIKAYC